MKVIYKFSAHPYIEWISALLLAVTLLTACGSSRTMLIYPPTGTPTPRPDTLYALNYMYLPEQASHSSFQAKRVVDSAQIQHFYEMANALPPFPSYPPSTTEQCYEYVGKGDLLFLSQGQPTLEVDIGILCGVYQAYLYGFIPGNPPQSGFIGSTGLAIPSDRRMANKSFVQMVQQAFQTGVSTPIQDIPYQPPPKQ